MLLCSNFGHLDHVAVAVAVHVDDHVNDHVNVDVNESGRLLAT
jgi:hypothetical protein